MKKSLFLFAAVLLTFTAFSQKVITVQSGSTSAFYSTIDSALSAATTGDNIYIPGGVYYAPNIIIDKGVHIYGAGHYPDSTTATGQTVISGNVRIITGANNSSISGLYILGDLYFGTGTSNNTVNNVLIQRCSMNNLSLSYQLSSNNNLSSQSILIKENVVRANYYGGHCPSLLFKQNILNGLIYYSSSNQFENNIFLFSNNTCNTRFIHYTDAASFINNIICFASGCGYSLLYNSDANLFTNNLFRGPSSSYFPAGTNIQYSNFFGFIDTAVFSGGTAYAFSYSEDYHMLPTCIAHNGGSDGTDPGIYGTATPYKPSAVPANPHIGSKSISTSTNAQGNLNVNLRVSAQDK